MKRLIVVFGLMMLPNSGFPDALCTVTPRKEASVHEVIGFRINDEKLEVIGTAKDVHKISGMEITGCTIVTKGWLSEFYSNLIKPSHIDAATQAIMDLPDTVVTVKK